MSIHVTPNTSAITIQGDKTGIFKERFLFRGLLDDYPTGTEGVAYSLRKLVTGANKCVRIRRDSDNAEQDIGFTSRGELNLAQLEQFCGSAKGFGVIWYNQGNNNLQNAVMPNAANQMYLWQGASGVVVNPDTGKPAFSSNQAGSPRLWTIDKPDLFQNRSYNRLYYTQYVTSTGPNTRNRAIFWASDGSGVTTANYRSMMLSGNTLGSQHVLTHYTKRPDGAAFIAVAVGVMGGWTEDTTLINFRYDWAGGGRLNRTWSPSLYEQSDSTAGGLTTNSPSPWISFPCVYSNANITNHQPGYSSEMIIYGNDAFDADNIAIENNIKEYWGIGV